MNDSTVTLHMQPLIESIPGDCPTCGFEALRWLRVYRLAETGVTMLGERLYCGRCKAEEKR
ncbi:hypothetical protein FVO59_11910 [Microbacterium esteraromaticum]|uniref:Uncharacterized protein n=1 Tax=Microbacterium esteraromaticum TaxID=57043 RepID=A0A7D7WGA1_9MICO|nr:hypothetical protein [Microbacterium esteraromaticum]QMU97832.1 hypothetical protein FVO59_11910 [Microbacterium esteraromaticum]